MYNFTVLRKRNIFSYEMYSVARGKILYEHSENYPSEKRIPLLFTGGVNINTKQVPMDRYLH